MSRKKNFGKKKFPRSEGIRERSRKIEGTQARLAAIAYRKNCLYAVARFRKQPILRPISWNDPKHMARCSVGKKERPATGGESHTHTRGKSINFERVTRARKSGRFLFHERSDREWKPDSFFFETEEKRNSWLFEGKERFNNFSIARESEFSPPLRLKIVSRKKEKRKESFSLLWKHISMTKEQRTLHR